MTELQKLKKKADAVTSKYVRNFYAKNGMVQCYTCGAVKPVAQIQCGHFVSRNNSATRYYLPNLRPQCAGCNVWGRGRYDVYADKLIDELGVREFRKLLKLGRSIHQLTIKELNEIIAKYAI